MKSLSFDPVCFGLAALLAVGTASSSSAQSAAGDVVFGPSEAERLQLQEMSRSSQASIRALQEDSQVIKLNATGVGTVLSIGSVPAAPPQMGSAFPNFIWSDNQGVWKMDKFGKQCAISSTSTSTSTSSSSSSSSSSSDPCS